MMLEFFNCLYAKHTHNLRSHIFKTNEAATPIAPTIRNKYVILHSFRLVSIMKLKYERSSPLLILPS